MPLMSNLRRMRRNIREIVNGTRHRELVRLLSSPQQGSARLAMSIAALEERARGGDIAVISCLPPSDTGIAVCSLLTYLDAPYKVDIFAPYARDVDFVRGMSDERIKDSPVRVFDIDSLPYALARGDYRAQILTIGNSEHHIPLARHVRDSRYFPSTVPLHVHIHDPILLYLAELVSREEGASVREALLRTYPHLRPDEELTTPKLIERHAYGGRVVLEGVEVKSIIANSEAGRAILARDFPGVPIHRLFHPVFPVRPARKADGGLVLGSFGVPGRLKQTPTIIEAFRLIKKSRSDARLVIAGYKAAAFARDHALDPREGFEIHDNPPDARFEAMLGTVDAAIQLRLENQGESSGVVSRLIGLGVPVIATDIGSFSDYGSAVRLVAPGIGAQELADTITQELQSPRTGTKTAAAAYAANHTAHRFCEGLWKIVQDTGGQGDDRSADG